MDTNTTNIINQWRGRIERSYAHNSRLYAHFERSASIDEIIRFLRWDSAQPPFFEFLARWIAKAPPSVLPALKEHIDEEIEEDHSGLFRKMMTFLENTFQVAPCDLSGDVLRDLNYTFSEESAARESFAFFAGSFHATEVMSEKRCRQILNGLLRLGVAESELEYLLLHSKADADHAKQVEDCFLTPLLEAGTSPSEVERGLNDRLSRSERYLRWYESRFLA